MSKTKENDLRMKQTAFKSPSVATMLRLEADLYERIREEAFNRRVSINYLLSETLKKAFAKK